MFTGNDYSCVLCGTDFIAMRPAKYCSDKCKFLYTNRKRQKDKGDLLREYKRNRYDKARELIRNYKLERGCADCGYKVHHAALEFDHIRDTKSFTIAAKAVQMCWGSLLKEIEKCEVVCANCHSIRTYDRAQVYRARDVGSHKTPRLYDGADEEG